MLSEKKKYLIVFIVLILFIVGLLVKLRVINLKSQATLKNTKELKTVLEKNDLTLIKEGLFEFSEKNKLNTTYTYKKSSLSNILETRFRAYVKAKNGQNETVLIRYIDNAYIIDYYDHDGKTVSYNEEDFDKIYDEPTFVKIHNKLILNKVEKLEKERILDSMNDYVYNNNIPYRYFYITKLKVEENKITLQALALNNRSVYLIGDIDKSTQTYNYRKVEVEE